MKFDDDGEAEKAAAIEFLRADQVWEFLQDFERRLDAAMQTTEGRSSELIKLVLHSRREVLEGFMEFVDLNSITFKELCGQLGYDIRFMEDS